MSIEASYRRVTPREFARLQSDAKAVESFFGIDLEDLDDPEKLLAWMEKQENSDSYLSIGKDWHALHFLLTGDSELKPHPLPPSPLSNVVQGGTPTQWPGAYGDVRSLTPNEVCEASDALSNISAEELRARFSVASFNAAQIYPHGRRACWTEEAVETVFEIYPRVVRFFQSAAREGNVVLLSSD